MITIIDYDMGNLGSIKNMLHKVGYNDVKISSEVKDIQDADKLILPGVGAFDQGMDNINRLGLYDPIRDAAINRRKPIMGICLGMQLLGKASEEGTKEGLSLVPFKSVRFTLGPEYKIPHMGWSDIKIKKIDAMVDNMVDESNRFYFVHSYHAVCEDEADTLMTCDYGYEFTAAISHDNIYGFQFHPEKSHRYGMELFKNFIKL